MHCAAGKGERVKRCGCPGKETRRGGDGGGWWRAPLNISFHSGQVVATESGGVPGAGRWWVVAVRAGGMRAVLGGSGGRACSGAP